MKQFTDQQIAFLRILIARFRSKSPKGYRIVLRICTTAASIMGIYIMIYTSNWLPKNWEPISGKINNVFVVLGAAATALGIGAASTTTDPDLMSKDTKEAVIKDAVEKQGDI